MGERLASRLRWSPLGVIAPLVLVAALLLGIYSFRSVAQVSSESERQLLATTRVLGEQTVQRIDSSIVDSERALFDLVDLEHLSDFPKVWNYIVRVSPAIEAVALLDDQLKILPGGFVSKRTLADAESFRSMLLGRILADLPLQTLRVDLHQHLHKSYDGRDVLITYIKRQREGRTYYIVLKSANDYILRELFSAVLAPLSTQWHLRVRDASGRTLWGQWPREPGRFRFEAQFPTTLYLWRLEMAPRDAAGLDAGDRLLRRSEYLLISLTLGVIVVGVLFLFYVSARERRANQLKSEFISNVSHELKTPLSLIRMFGELLALGRVRSPDKGREYAEIITRESERLGRLIDNVLDFSRMERGRAAYEFAEAELAPIIERALDLYRPRVEREGFSLVTKVDADLPPLPIDGNALTLLLLNLLENALKYGRSTDGSGHELFVYLTRVGDHIRLVVGDHGAGIPKEEQVRIFDRFYRTSAARNTSVRGSGIGLALVKHIAEAHHGRVTVDSEPGAGAAFLIDLPIRSGLRPSMAGEASA